MTRVVVPRGNASNTTQSRAPAASSASSVPPPPPLPSSNALPTATEDSDHVSEAPVPSRDGDLTENASQLVSSIRLDESRHAGSDCEGAREQESTAVQTPSVSASSSDDGSLRTGTVAATSSTSSSAARAPTGLRRGNSVASSRGYSAQRIRISATSSSNAQATEVDGYNSADETNPWASGPPAFEEDEDKESHFEEELRRVKGLEVRRMLPDGNCLFRAVADQVYGDPEMYADTRQMCIDYMERERDHFSQFVTEGFTAYCKRKRRDKVYGNNLEIQAMAEMYNRPIHIYSYSTDPINIFHGQYQTDLPPIRLSYHRKNHYNALHDPSRPAVGAGLGFGSLRGNNVDRDQVKAAIRAQQDQQIENALLAEGRYYSDLELTEQEIERMVMEASRAEYLAEERHRQIFETSSSAGGEPSTSGAARGSGSGGSQVSLTATTENNNNVVQARNSNVRMLLSMGFNYFRVMEACSIFGDDVNNMLCYLLETDSLGESMYRMKGKAAEK